MMSLWDALRMNMMISYQELVRTFPKITGVKEQTSRNAVRHIKNDLNFPDRDYIILSSIYALSYGRVVGNVIKILKGNVNSLLIQ
ncbi:hypothetical protein C4Y95_023715 [Klebsiella pneumoniae subsp. pneumoniae]|nr:hypothetical protein C4Y95_023715 [Klebsiella pneumoniae subsp. pneumoniae]